jgi:hypothetical protein
MTNVSDSKLTHYVIKHTHWEKYTVNLCTAFVMADSPKSKSFCPHSFPNRCGKSEQFDITPQHIETNNYDNSVYLDLNLYSYVHFIIIHIASVVI